MERVDRRVGKTEGGSSPGPGTVGVTAEKGFRVDAGKLPVGQEDSMHFRKGFWEPREENLES